MPKAKPPLAVPYLTVGFGSKPQRLRMPPGTPPGTTNPVVSRTVPTAGAGLAKPAGVTTTSLPVGAAPAGRPKSNLGNYLIRPTANDPSGYEMLNDTPDLISAVEEKFLKLKVLPTALRPTRLSDPRTAIGYTKRPAVMEANRAKAISRGWRDPRGRRG